MLKENKVTLACLSIHLSLFSGIVLSAQRMLDPESSLVDVIIWYGGLGIFFFELFHGSGSWQVLGYLGLTVTGLYTTYQYIKTRNHDRYLIRLNGIIAALYTLPYLISAFGHYIGP